MNLLSPKIWQNPIVARLCKLGGTHFLFLFLKLKNQCRVSVPITRKCQVITETLSKLKALLLLGALILSSSFVLLLLCNHRIKQLQNVQKTDSHQHVILSERSVWGWTPVRFPQPQRMIGTLSVSKQFHWACQHSHQPNILDIILRMFKHDLDYTTLF